MLDLTELEGELKFRLTEGYNNFSGVSQSLNILEKSVILTFENMED